MALIVLGTVGNSFSPYKVGNTTILASGTFTETGITVEDSCKFMRFWFAGNGSSSYYVTSAFLVQGALSLPITVYGKTSFYVPSYGRASDVMSISNFTTPGEISSVVNIATNQTLPVFNEGTIITSIIETNAYDLSDEWSDLPTSAFPDSSVRGKIIGDGPLVYTLHFTLPAMPPYSGDIGFLGLIFMDSSNTGLALFFENFDGGGMWFGPPDTWGDRVGSILKNVTQDVTMEIDRRDDITGYDYYMRIARQWTSGGTTYTDSFDRTYSCSPGDLDIYDLKNYACNGLFLRGSILSSVAYDVTNLSMTVDLLNDPEEITTTVILAVTCNPTNGDTLTINNSQERVFTFVNYFPLLSTQIQIGTDDYAGTAVNIANKINAIDGAEFSATAVDDGGYYKVTITGHTDTGVTITTTSACITVNDATSIIPSLLQENISASNSMSATDGGKEQSENATVSDVIDVLMEDITESSSASTNFNCLIEILEESCSVSDEMDGLINMIAEEASVADSFTVIDAKTITDGLDIADGVGYPSILMTQSASDGFVFADTPTWVLNISLSDIIFLWDALQHGWKVSVDESLVASDSILDSLGIMIDEWITLTDSQSNNWNGREIVNQNLNLYDLAEQIQTFANTVNEDLTIGDAPGWALTVAVLEYMWFADLAAAMRSTAATLSESVTLADSPDHAWQEIISEALQAVDTQSVITTFINVVSESLTAEDAASLINRLGLTASESLVLTETLTSKGTLYNAVYDTIVMNVTVELAGEVYECYVLNTPKFHPSMYSGFNFNSYCVFENRAFGANSTGIYELTGTTDAGTAISTGVVLSETDFGSRNYKRFRKGYLGISGSSPKMVLEDEDGSRKVYDISSEGMAVFSHEQKSKKWKLSLANFDTLDVMKLIPVVLRK